MRYNINEIVNNVHVGPVYDVLKDFVGVPKSDNYHSVRNLADIFSPSYRLHLTQKVDEYTAKMQVLKDRYPLIERLDYSSKEEDVIHYINLIDKV